ncbi:MAG: protein kinase domain-containing protein [Roseibacillus sp.]
MSEDASPFELLPAEEVENLLPSYSQISFLAKGGMAAVYRGVQTSLERPVAIKMLPAEFGADESFRLRFVAEGKAMARLNHPNLVGIFDFGQVDNLLYLVMEFVEGQTLHEHAYGSPMDELEAVDLCQKVADGLAHAHEHGILHRDIKPANVLLDKNLNPKLGDFGLAEGDEREEGDDLVFGTPGYTSPEVMANPAAADEKADIFAIGIMLYELITTTLPADPYQPPSRVANTDPRIDPIIATAIQPDPNHRYASASELAASLKSLHEKMKAAPRKKLATKGSSGSAARTLKVDAPAPPKDFPNPGSVLATGDSNGGSAAPPRSPAPAMAGAAPSNLPLIRNLIIIGMLCAAIAVAWDALKGKQARIDKENQVQIEKADREKARKAKLEAARLAKMQGGGSPTNSGQGSATGKTKPTEPHVPEVEAPIPLSPREQLDELQSALQAGERDRFPEGSKQRGTARYFFINDALTWYEAIEFAESYGGHLAMAPKDSDLSWLAKEIPTDDDIWLGAGAISRSDWEWLDDSIEFEHKKPRTSTGTAAMVTNTGFIRAREPSLKLPFFIQWNDNGKRLGSREIDFLQLSETLTTSAPSWPPGVISYEERRYLILGRSLTQSEAAAIAASAGGALAVPSNELEASFLMEAVTKSGLSALWLGGEKRGDAWAWSTNEPWEFARWNDGYPLPAEKAVALQTVGKGWINTDPYQDAPGFIIEWSDDAKNAPESEVAQNDGLAALNTLRAKAKRFLATEQKKTLKVTKDNYLAQGMAMRQMLRNIAKEDAKVIGARYEKYLAASAGSRLLDPADSPIAGANDAVKILTRYFEIQSEAEAKLVSTAAKVRISYHKEIDDLITDAKAKGLASQVSPMEKEKVATGTSGASFLRHLGL